MPDTTAELVALCPHDPARAARLLERLAESAGAAPERLAALLLPALADAADADLALLNLERWAAHLPTPHTTLALLQEDPRLLADLLSLFAASQYLADILAREPSLYALFLEADRPRTAGEYREAVESALRPLRRPESRRDALRRVKRREFLRIGWRDLCRRAPLPEIVREISDLADALVAGALQLAREEVDPRFPTAREAVQLSIIAMGKLGARELNYSSDIDLMFVMDTTGPGGPPDEPQRRYATRLAETVIAVLSAPTGEGRCFRVDMRLRPEGRAGALVRSLHAFRDYYDRWAETWERQALIKARPVAGDTALGERFMALIQGVIYRRLQGPTILEEVREMRAMVERKLAASGAAEGHVKEGRGTLRDVEFTVQLLQLLFGASRPALQVRDTWTALARLEACGLLAPEQRAIFAAGYRFFREVEHRLQLFQDLPVRRLPAEPAALRRLARTMGFPAGEELLAAYLRHSDAVRGLAETIHARLGVQTGACDTFRSLLLLADTPEGEAGLRAVLAAREFPALDAAARALVRLASGAPQLSHNAPTRRLFADLAPTLLDACAAAADPTWALEGLADFADRKLLHRALYQSLGEQPDLLRALSLVAGGAPAAMHMVLRFPELSELVSDTEQLSRRRSAAELEADLRGRLAGAGSRRLAVLRRFKIREWLRLAARRVLAPRVPPAAETAEWSDAAGVLLRAALDTALDRLREARSWSHAGPADFAVLALGRFGGEDLHFASDLDLLFVFGAEAGLPQQEYEALARALGEVLRTTTEEGRLFDVDLRLRPEGRQGYSVAGLEAAARYYGPGGRAQTWEFQMLTRLRFAAGSAVTAARLRELVEPRVFRDPYPAAWDGEIRAMKRRIETERVAERDRERHLKLGPGGLSDIEFLVQVLQLRHGAAHPAVRCPSTTGAVRALEAAAVLAPEEAEVLLAGHAFLTDARQALSLLRLEGASDCLPDPEQEPRLASALARSLRAGSPAELEAAHRAHARSVRELFLRHVGDPGREGR